MSAVDGNIKSLQHLFPLVSFQLDKQCCPPQLTVTCPKSLKAKVSSAVQEDVRALQMGQCVFPFAPGSQDSGGSLPEAVQQLQQRLQGQALLVEYKAASAEVVITAFENVLPSVQQKAGAWLGLVVPPNAPQAASAPAPRREQETVALLQASLGLNRSLSHAAMFCLTVRHLWQVHSHPVVTCHMCCKCVTLACALIDCDTLTAAVHSFCS